MSLFTWLRQRFGNHSRPAVESISDNETAVAAEAKLADPIEERLDQMMQEILPHLVRPIPEFLEALRDNFHLQLEYPNQYVAWVDDRVIDDKGKTRVKRRILAHGTDLAEVILAVNSMPREVRGDWIADYIRDPDDHCVYL